MCQEDTAAGRVKIVTFDLSDLSNINAAMQKVLTCYGHVDIVINNGGLSYRGSIEETSLDVDMAVMNVNYFGQVAVTKGKLDGVWTSYDVNGNKIASGNYSNGTKTGKWFFWSGSSLNEVDYSNNNIANIKTWKQDATIANN